MWKALEIVFYLRVIAITALIMLFKLIKNNQAFVFVAIADLVSHQSWYTNSGATNHVSTKLSNFSLKSYYHGENKLVIDNGNKLPITHVGHIEIPFLSSHFYLRNIPLVPQIKKSLLSISFLMTNNRIFVEFYFNVCLVKDKKNPSVLGKET